MEIKARYLTLLASINSTINIGSEKNYDIGNQIRLAITIKKLLIMYTNADTILNKREELEGIILERNPDIISIVEHFLS